MSEELINHYKADEREMHFLLFEQFRVQDYFGKAPFEEASEDDAKMILGEALKFAKNEIGPLNGYGDRTKCKFDPATGDVKVPPLHKEMQQKFVENGWNLMRVSPDYGGTGVPYCVSLLASEFFTGACASWMMYPGLTMGAAHLIETFGSEELKETYCAKLYSNEWMGTMCLTEPGAGSDVGRSSTKATPNGDGTYSIQGVKCFISGGDHDYTPNIVHMVLARVEGAQPGTKGLSLFVIPKFRVNPDGSLGEKNDVICRGIERKMGIHASATCTMNFGDNGKCIGFLLGDAENQGIRMMFQMMNEARIGTGMQALATASSAYLNAVQYARERVQGQPFMDIAQRKRTEAVNLIKHEDIRRMLTEMKAKIEGCRALALKLAVHMDKAHVYGLDSAEGKKELGYVELLTPLVKAYLSDQGFRVTELAIQTYGGYGYISDYPVEQACRDVKIQSLYEGTNYIQSLDLVGRKLSLEGGKLVRNLIDDITEFCKANKDHEELKIEVERLKEASKAFAATTMGYMQFMAQGKLQQIPLTATRFLEMMSEITLGFLLMQGAVVAHAARKNTAQGDREHNYYTGKILTAKFFIRNILPGVKMKAEIIADCDTSAVEMEDANFPMLVD